MLQYLHIYIYIHINIYLYINIATEGHDMCCEMCLFLCVCNFWFLTKLVNILHANFNMLVHSWSPPDPAGANTEPSVLVAGGW